MNKLGRAGVVVLSLLVASPAVAGPKIVVYPVQVGSETIRYKQGVPTLDLEKARGAVQITPLPLDHGSLSFSVAVYNNGDASANIDISNFSVTAGPQQLPVFSREELESKAENRAMWTQIGLAVLGGVAAGVSASETETYRSTLVTPRGTYRAYYTRPSLAGQLQADAMIAGTGMAIASVENQLDETRAALGDNIVQLTTVEPGESYAGQIVVKKIKSKKLPQKVDIVVHWNGEDYPFAFQVAKPWTMPPPFTAFTPTPPATGVVPVENPVQAPANSGQEGGVAPSKTDG
jgi:hypothetical protein